MYKDILTMTRRTWFQVGRIIVLGLFVLFGILFLGWQSVGKVYSIVGFVVVLSVFLDFLFRRNQKEREWQVWVQFILDSILASVLIRMAGGFDGPFTAFFFIHTFTAGVFLGIRGGLVIAVLDSLMIASMAFVTFSSLIDVTPTGSAFERLMHTVPSNISFQYALLFVLIYVGFLTITGLVSGYLSQHLLLEKGRSEGILRELREARTVSREILESLSDGILVIDNSGNPVSINHSGREILSLGDKWREGVCNTDIYTMLKEFQLAESMPSVIELSMDNTILECRMGTFLDHEGNSAGALVAMTDITETFELKRQLQEQEKLAAIGRLSSTMAHEIRNPLASMSGAAHILQMGTLDWKKTDRMTELISHQAKRISEIIEGYLELSRESKVSYTNSVSLAAVVNEAIDVARQGFGGLVKIESHIEGDFIVFGNQARLVQLLTNIMRNSVEVLENIIDGKIIVSLLKSSIDGMVELSVHDNGPGIPDDVMVHIFDPFFTTKKEGTGLGLFVARKVARDHRGRMDIESESGVGTTVKVSIPIAPPDVVTAETGGNK
ncbi:hypothetical protein DRQ25_16890 [Candidatus Fermentibacteria bacterium]|nr:MAG: hypothetical protein DRQ25_16890 [Candidatus Fermentibacteria bacterium]